MTAVCEIFSVKEWCDLENRVRIRSRSLEMAPFDRSHTTSHTSVRLSARSCIPSKRVNIIQTSASVKLTQTRHSHSKQLFHEAQILQGFYREGQKVDTCNRKFPFESNRQIVVYSLNVKFLLIAIWDRSQMFRFVKNIARSLLGY